MSYLETLIPAVPSVFQFGGVVQYLVQFADGYILPVQAHNRDEAQETAERIRDSMTGADDPIEVTQVTEKGGEACAFGW